MLDSSVGFNPDFDESDLDEREREVLGFLSSEQNGYFSFQGLRRRLGFHQETLTRTLKRLEEAQVVERTAQGYKVRNPGNAYSFPVRTAHPYTKPVIDAYLPTQIDVTVLFQKLRGRWFSNFRWLGYSHDGTQLSMSWISEDGQMQLQARIGGGKITITAESFAKLDESHQISAAYQLFDHITKVADEMVQLGSPTPVGN